MLVAGVDAAPLPGLLNIQIELRKVPLPPPRLEPQPLRPLCILRRDSSRSPCALEGAAIWHPCGRGASAEVCGSARRCVVGDSAATTRS
eukprot:5808358-Prymnesium_polylepis.1